MGGHSFLQGIFLTQGPNLGLFYLLHCRQILYHLGHPGSGNSQSPTSERLRETPPSWSPPVSQVTILCLTLVGGCPRAHDGPASLCHVVCKGGAECGGKGSVVCMSLCKVNVSWESCRCEGVRVSQGVCRQSILSGEWLWALPQASEIRYPFSSTGYASSQSKGNRAGMCYYPQQEAVTEHRGGCWGKLRGVQAPCPTNPKQQNWTQEPGGTNSGLCLTTSPSQPPWAQKLPDPGTSSKGRWGLWSLESTEVLPDLSLWAAAPPIHQAHIFFFPLFIWSSVLWRTGYYNENVFEDPHEVHFPCLLKAKKVCGGDICIHGECPTYHLGARVHGGTDAGRWMVERGHSFFSCIPAFLQLLESVFNDFRSLQLH